MTEMSQRKKSGLGLSAMRSSATSNNDTNDQISNDAFNLQDRNDAEIVAATTYLRITSTWATKPLAIKAGLGWISNSSKTRRAT